MKSPAIRLRALASVLVAALLAGARAAQEVASTPPDVLLVLADDLGWPEFDDAATPALDRLAAEGVTLTRFYAMPNCSPSRHALLHGRWPRRTGLGSVTNSYAPPSPRNPTPSPSLSSLPRLLHARGYHTALVGKWHLGQAAAAPGADPMLSAPLAHGFDHWLAGAPANLNAREGASYSDWLRVDDGVEQRSSEFATRAQRDAALRWWRETPSPKFLLVSLSAVHQPLQQPPEDLLPPGVQAGTKARTVLSAMISSVDTVVRDLRAAVDPERAYFLFLSDNGTAPGTYGPAENAKGTTFDRGVRVPFVGVGPGIPRGQRCAAPVAIVDVLATVCEAAGVHEWRGPEGGGEDSVSFLGALREPASWRPPRPWVLVEIYDEERDDWALLDAGWKLRSLDGKEELYELVGEPPVERAVSLAGALEPRAQAGLDALRALRKGLPPRGG